MKQIEVSDEMYQKLIDLATEMTTQDMRCTAMPHLFQIKTREQVAAPEGNGTEAWHYEGSLIETDEEIEEAVNQYKEWDEHTTKFNSLEDYEVEEILEAAGYNQVWYDYQDKYQNAFLTAKACKEHIEANHYHYSEPVDYLNHCWRNPEMDLVSDFLCGLVNKKKHKS